MFISLFGTHYYQIGKFGGYLYQKSVIDNSYLEGTRKEEISANLKLSFDSFFKLGLKANAEIELVTEDSKKRFSSNTQRHYYNYGGTSVCSAMHLHIHRGRE
mgnify:CR=1 FL=1